MFHLKWLANYCFLIMIIFWSNCANCMIIENLSLGIFKGNIAYVQGAIDAGENVSERLYSKELKKWIEPLSFAISRLNCSIDVDDLCTRLAIIALLINSGAEINKNSHRYVEKIKDKDLRNTTKELLINKVIEEFTELQCED